jgi:hypothetical protein
MRRPLLLVALLWALTLTLAGAARGDTGLHPDTFAGDYTIASLDALASHWARRPVHVECPKDWGSWNADESATGAYGYTWLDADWTRVEPDVCPTRSAPQTSSSRSKWTTWPLLSWSSRTSRGTFASGSTAPTRAASSARRSRTTASRCGCLGSRTRSGSRSCIRWHGASTIAKAPCFPTIASSGAGSRSRAPTGEAGRLHRGRPPRRGFLPVRRLRAARARALPRSPSAVP